MGQRPQERRKFRATVPVGIVCMAVFLVAAGVSVVAYALEFEVQVDLLGIELGGLSGWILTTAFGLGLLACAVGLWRARPWARWVAALFFGSACVQSSIASVRDHELSLGLPFTLAATIYLLLPSTGRRSARVCGGGAAGAVER